MYIANGKHFSGFDRARDAACRAVLEGTVEMGEAQVGGIVYFRCRMIDGVIVLDVDIPFSVIDIKAIHGQPELFDAFHLDKLFDFEPRVPSSRPAQCGN